MRQRKERRTESLTDPWVNRSSPADRVIVILLKCKQHKMGDYRPPVFGKLCKALQRNCEHAHYVRQHRNIEKLHGILFIFVNNKKLTTSCVFPYPNAWDTTNARYFITNSINYVCYNQIRRKVIVSENRLVNQNILTIICLFIEFKSSQVNFHKHLTIKNDRKLLIDDHLEITL